MRGTYRKAAARQRIGVLDRVPATRPADGVRAEVAIPRLVDKPDAVGSRKNAEPPDTPQKHLHRRKHACELSISQRKGRYFAGRQDHQPNTVLKTHVETIGLELVLIFDAFVLGHQSDAIFTLGSLNQGVSPCAAI